MNAEPEVHTCSRCAKRLTPGRGELYLVQIEAIADPSPPILDALAAAEIETRIDAILERLRDKSADAALDQVFRRVVIYLCAACYTRWIEDPAGAM